MNGSICGTITDPSGAPIAEITITVKNLAAGFTRQVASNGDGVYLEPNLPIDTHSASSAHGFAPIT
ncbi:carboxypeptidase-like regulatory domain-containing protein [Telmatobacter bradus]|uniref:carboxypeptidase-like regulatory domain-containing protein n=1 Tax=Telmatobacter bradus TaxID=474953 RepID=UPI003B42AB3A